MITEQQVREAVRGVQDPELKKSLLDLGMIRDIAIAADGQVSLTLALTTSICPEKDALVGEIKQVLEQQPGVSVVEVNLVTLNEEELQRLFSQHPLVGLKKVHRVLAVASGKGGVGKTTLAVNVALALSLEGNRVGLLDADVYGPSVPVMLALNESLQWENRMMLPVKKFGLQIISLGMMAKEGQALVWRGPMVGKAIRQLLEQVLWGELDYLVVDLPPGTGDPSITVAQSIPDADVLMVTTPQEVALADVCRAVGLFRKFDLNILGLIENMSYFICGHSSVPIEIFGRGGGMKLSNKLNLPLLGTIPIDLEIRIAGDAGVPLMVSAPDSEAGRIFQRIVRNIPANIPAKVG